MTALAMQQAGNMETYRRGWSALLNATHEFASLDRPTREDISRYKELFYTLCLKGTDPEIRIIANTLAFNHYVPRSIVYLLSLCKTKIAEQMVLFSPVLKTRDLIAILDKAGSRHAELVARRSDIDLEVVEKVLSFDDDDEALRRTLKQNASLKSKAEVQTLLAGKQRSETQVKSVIREREAPIKSASVPQTGGKDASYQLLELAGKGGKIGREHSARTVQESTLPETDGFKLLQYARERQTDAFAWRVERRCKLPSAYTSELIASKDTGGLAALLRSLEIPKVEAARILLLLTPALGRETSVFKQVVAMYGQLNLEECRAHLRSLGADFENGWAMSTDRMRQIRSEAMRSGHAALENTGKVPDTQTNAPMQEAAG